MQSDNATTTNSIHEPDKADFGFFEVASMLSKLPIKDKIATELYAILDELDGPNGEGSQIRVLF